MLKNLRYKISNMVFPERNSASYARDFLRYGNRKEMMPDWTQVVMSDKDVYTGYSYAAINKRSKVVIKTAIKNIYTDSKTKDFVHPYLEIMEKSPSFTETEFWKHISTYLDLEGVYYLMAVRNYDGKKYGTIQEFKLLNPYNIKRILDPKKLTVAGYVETRGTMVREIPPQMIIEVRELNPFNQNEPFAMTDAAKEAQFTIKTAGDYTRHALKHNINAPGIMSTGIILEDEEFKNFTNRVKKHTKGEPLFGNGEGAINWDSMNIELSKAALKDINDMNKETLFAISGVSKTALGIEQSGTTRETARVQKDMLTEFEAIPRIQDVLDSLNQDYKNNYPDEYKKNEAKLMVNDPTNSDNDAEETEINIRQKKSDLYNDLVEKGYDEKLVAQYVEGEIGIEMLGKPKTPEKKEEPKEKSEESIHICSCHDHQDNKLDNDSLSLVKQQESSLKNSVINIQNEIMAEAIDKVKKKVKNSAFEEESDIISKKSKKGFTNDLEIVLASFYAIIMTLQGNNTAKGRAIKYEMPATFAFNKAVKDYIKETANKVAESHIDTLANEIYETARKASLTGAGQQEIISQLKKEYSDVVTTTRATTVARTESNRAFTRAQYEADVQFIKENELKGRVYKQWITRSDDPCPFCRQLAAQGKIPFEKPFASLGDILEVDGKKLPINFEELQAGNAHPNCSCAYELIVESEEKK